MSTQTKAKVGTCVACAIHTAVIAVFAVAAICQGVAGVIIQ